MTNQEMYDVAEWLVHNVDAINARVRAFYSNMNKEDAIAYMIGEEMKYDYVQVQLALQDERVKLVLDRYYLKELQ